MPEVQGDGEELSMSTEATDATERGGEVKAEEVPDHCCS